MNPLKALKKLFGSKQKVKPLLYEKQRIRLLDVYHANTDIPSSKYRAIGEIVIITKSCVLIFLFEKDDRLFFRVKNPFYSPISIVQDDDIVYFSRYVFLNSLKYKII